MQLVLSNNRVIAHGENFLAMGSVVINTETGARFENATVAECEGCPSDIDKVGYEYHAGVFVPCAPFGRGNNNGFFMEVCESCATPRNSGIKIKGGIKLENLDLESITALALGGASTTLLWENGSPASAFGAQGIELGDALWDFLIITTTNGTTFTAGNGSIECTQYADGATYTYFREHSIQQLDNGPRLWFEACYQTCLRSSGTISHTQENRYVKPLKVYGVKI